MVCSTIRLFFISALILVPGIALGHSILFTIPPIEQVRTIEPVELDCELETIEDCCQSAALSYDSDDPDEFSELDCE